MLLCLLHCHGSEEEGGGGLKMTHTSPSPSLFSPKCGQENLEEMFNLLEKFKQKNMQDIAIICVENEKCDTYFLLHF